MSFDWVKDIAEMQYKYGVKAWMLENQDDKEKMRKYLEFRINFLREELDETQKAFAESDPEEIVDGLIDLCVVAIGTLDAYGINPYTAWDQVLKANMNKEVGVKPERPNPLGLPDLIKPEGWEAPSHEGNHGKFNNIR
jgi:predicted HAD superfamily Cof-like phosphohydrolase|tara:strand:+ start:129 stop:542 length:414 start_codon:yes stop_codon:yes gene_type:complete